MEILLHPAQRDGVNSLDSNCHYQLMFPILACLLFGLCSGGVPWEKPGCKPDCQQLRTQDEVERSQSRRFQQRDEKCSALTAITTAAQLGDLQQWCVCVCVQQHLATQTFGSSRVWLKGKGVKMRGEEEEQVSWRDGGKWFDICH